LLVPRRPATKPSESSIASVLRLKIRLLEVSPMIWRRVLVPASYTLEELHGLFKWPWAGSPFTSISFSSALCIMVSFDLCVSSPNRMLTSFRFRKGAKFIYEYDMGDFWRHEVPSRINWSRTVSSPIPYARVAPIRVRPKTVAGRKDMTGAAERR
jgi:hypothetical protein